MPTLKEALVQRKIVPNKDIVNNTITENSFAVGFNAVIQGSGDDIYTNPDTFFSLTHMTRNLTGILTHVLRRVDSGEGSPLLVLDTTFGGGKTHTLVTLFHLFKRPDAAMKNPEIKKVLNQVDLKKVPEIALVAIDGHRLSSVQREGKVRTIWGEMARQLGQYEMMKVFDQKLRRPDSETLETLISSVDKPIVILLDELVNYLKDSRGEEDEESHLAETTVAFFHTLTDVIANSKNAMFILTLPGTEAAYKREADLLEEYKRTIRELGGREAAFTVPMDRSEIYDVVRKRLFEKVDQSVASSVIEDILRFYGTHPEHFSQDIFTHESKEKFIKSYPFHPLLIDLLYERIATIPEFQKTRSVLRILSYTMRNILQNIDEIGNDKIITPSLIDFTDSSLLQEFTSKIARNEYQFVISSDIVNDEKSGKCQKVDKKPYGQMARIATSIYLYSLIGTTKEASLGCSQNELILATASEGYSYPKDILTDAQNLEKQLWYIYNKNGKYFFSSIANLNKIISDEIAAWNDEDLYNPEIKKRLRKLLASDYFDVRIWEEDIRNPSKPTLIVPHYRAVRSTEGKIPEGARGLIEREGTSFRTKKNLVSVLIAHDDRIERMTEAAQRYLAINELKGDQKNREDLKSHGSKLDEYLKEADTTLNMAIERSYSLIYYPKGTEIKVITVANGYEGAKKYSDKVYYALVKAQKIVESLNPEYIVDRVIGSKEGEITVQYIWSRFEEVPVHMYPASRQVMIDALSQGIDAKQFGIYAGGIGDLQLITIDNYQKIGEQFYYGRVPSGGIKDGYYLLLKDEAQEIESQLQTIARSVAEKGKKKGKKGEEPEPVRPTIKTTTIHEPAQLKEYLDWSVKQLDFSFGDVRFFVPVKRTLSTLLLGVSGTTFSVDVQSRLMQFSVRETAIVDTNEFLDTLARITGMFDEDLRVTVRMHYSSPPSIDEDYAESFNEIAGLIKEVSFGADLEKAGETPFRYD